jgi:endonuclease YncB( thermonuclease family)
LEQLTATSLRMRTIERRACAAALLAVLALVPDHADAASRKTASRAASAKTPQCPSEGTRGVVFGKALDGSSFVTPDGTEIRLAGVLSPGEGGETLSSGQADAARATLAALLRSGPLTLAGDEGPRDRYGRVHAQVFAGGASVQSALLRAGEVRVAPDRASALCDLEFIAAEGEARAQRSGHWRDGLFALRTPEQLDNRTGTFQIVEGTVTTATLYKGRAAIRPRLHQFRRRLPEGFYRHGVAAGHEAFPPGEVRCAQAHRSTRPCSRLARALQRPGNGNRQSRRD